MNFLKELTEDELTGVAFKNMNLKKNIIRLLDIQVYKKYYQDHFQILQDYL